MVSLLKTVSALPETQKVKPVKQTFRVEYEDLMGSFVVSEEDFMVIMLPAP